MLTSFPPPACRPPHPPSPVGPVPPTPLRAAYPQPVHSFLPLRADTCAPFRRPASAAPAGRREPRRTPPEAWARGRESREMPPPPPDSHMAGGCAWYLRRCASGAPSAQPPHPKQEGQSRTSRGSWRQLAEIRERECERRAAPAVWEARSQSTRLEIVGDDGKETQYIFPPPQHVPLCNRTPLAPSSSASHHSHLLLPLRVLGRCRFPSASDSPTRVVYQSLARTAPDVGALNCGCEGCCACLPKPRTAPVEASGEDPGIAASES
ncbi:hypothetical protein DFH09DRAFT_1328617 [Mycena vulgaris]|nr:hypothetical protein DFH09DRAFT_1328617 [Mycena vulgaris]